MCNKRFSCGITLSYCRLERGSGEGMKSGLDPHLYCKLYNTRISLLRLCVSLLFSIAYLSKILCITSKCKNTVASSGSQNGGNIL